MEEVRTALSGSGKLMEMIKTSLQQLLKDDALVVNHLENGDVVFKVRVGKLHYLTVVLEK